MQKSSHFENSFFMCKNGLRG